MFIKNITDQAAKVSRMRRLVFKSITTAWKQFALYAIPRAVKFKFRNLTGDFDSLLAGNPSALKFVPQTIRELSAAYYRGSRNVMVQSAQKIGEYKELKQFADLISELETQCALAWKKLPRQALNLLDKFLW